MQRPTLGLRSSVSQVNVSDNLIFTSSKLCWGAVNIFSLLCTLASPSYYFTARCYTQSAVMPTVCRLCVRLSLRLLGLRLQLQRFTLQQNYSQKSHACRKRWVFSFDRNCRRLLCGERRSGGSAFLTTGAAMEKLRWPMDVFARETNSHRGQPSGVTDVTNLRLGRILAWGRQNQSRWGQSKTGRSRQQSWTASSQWLAASEECHEAPV